MCNFKYVYKNNHFYTKMNIFKRGKKKKYVVESVEFVGIEAIATLQNPGGTE